MSPTDVETTYELLATQLDKFDESVAPVYLAKLALLMAARISDMDVIQECIVSAAADLKNATDTY